MTAESILSVEQPATASAISRVQPTTRGRLCDKRDKTLRIFPHNRVKRSSLVKFASECLNCHGMTNSIPGDLNRGVTRGVSESENSLDADQSFQANSRNLSRSSVLHRHGQGAETSAGKINLA
jgi:hypothetical protein